MRFSKTTTNSLLSIGAAALFAFGLASVAPAPASAQARPVPDTYKAQTVNMSPADIELKADVLGWSGDQDREAVVAALGQEDPAAALRELPTLGVVWRSGSAVGHSIKYAHRTTAADGSETLTLVTDKAIGATSFAPWSADQPATDAELDYSVIEMTTNGEGTMSLAAPVVIDEALNIVSLDEREGPAILTNVRKEPKPYWARTDD
jgi:hypothetical protein